MAHCASNIFQKNNILVLEDSEHSFIVLGKDLIKSLRGSSPDEGVSDCDESDEQSIFSSVSNCNSNAADTKVHETLKEQNIEVDNNIVMKEHEYKKKITTFQNEVAAALRETSENRDLLRSVGGSIDEIDRVVDYIEQSVNSTIASNRTRNFSLDTDDVTLVSLKSAKMVHIPPTETQHVSSMKTASVSASVESLIQDAISDVTEEQSMGVSKAQTEFSAADLRKLQNHLKKMNASDIDPRDVAIVHLKLMNMTLKEQIGRLEMKIKMSEPADVKNIKADGGPLRKLFVDSGRAELSTKLAESEDRNKDSVVQMDQYSEPFSPSVNFAENLNAYKEALQKLEASFASSYFRYTEGQNIILKCVKIINGIKSMQCMEDSSLIESDLVEYKRKLTNYGNTLTHGQIQIVEDKTKMIDAEQQFHRILSDYSSLVRKLASVTLENSKLKDEKADLSQQLESLRNKKDFILENVDVWLETLQQKMNATVKKAKYEIADLETFMGTVDNQEQSHNIEESNLLLRENVTELTKELEAIKVENDALLEENKKWSEERKSQYESNKLLEDELKLSKEKCGALEKENDLLTTIYDIYKEDLDDVRAKLADARMMISELQAQNSDLQESEISIDVYINRIEKQEMDILRLRATVESNLSQIESLTDENNIFRDYINHKFLKQ